MFNLIELFKKNLKIQMFYHNLLISYPKPYEDPK